MDIVVATQNKDKLEELRKLFRGLKKIKFISLEAYPHMPRVREDGKTYEENAAKKARLVARHTNKIAIADDSGLEVNILKGKPGLRSARFAGNKATYEDNNLKLLKLLKPQYL